jgi:hypothetical protein
LKKALAAALLIVAILGGATATPAGAAMNTVETYTLYRGFRGCTIQVKYALSGTFAGAAVRIVPGYTNMDGCHARATIRSSAGTAYGQMAWGEAWAQSSLYAQKYSSLTGATVIVDVWDGAWNSVGYLSCSASHSRCYLVNPNMWIR